MGKRSQTLVYILYDEELANPETVKILKERIDNIKVDILLAAGQLEKFINNKKRSLFPTLMITERPDRTTLKMQKLPFPLII